jgi:Yip1 domain
MDLVPRVTNILTKPKQEWPVIASEATDVVTLYKEYIVLLAAVPAICSFIGMTVIGVPVPFFGTMRVGVASGLTSLIVRYVLSLASVYAAAFIIEKLAPTFQSRGDTIQALKLVAYASTPAWVAGVLGLFPPLVALGILAGLYGVYLFYLGLPQLMQTPPDKVIPYMIVSAIVIIVMYVIVGTITAATAGVGMMTHF